MTARYGALSNFFLKITDLGLVLCALGLTIVLRYSPSNNVDFAFDYLSQGVPFLASDLPDWRAMFIDAGFARECDPSDPASLARAIRWFSDHPDEARAMGERGRQQVASAWNYEQQFEPVLRLMEGAVAA